MGLCSNDIRLPLTEMEDGNRAKLIALMKKHGILA
jgi:hypothetical protein